MVAVCIIGLLTAIGAVSVKPMWQKHQLRQSVGELEDRIQLLRLKAIIENETFEMKISDRYLVYRKKQGNSWENWKKHRLVDAVHYSLSGSVYFDRKGFASPCTIQIKLGDRSQKLTININGRVKIGETI
jgi:Tfp pilus assembly protein FimT